MNEERQMILQMLSEGQITVAETEKLLDSLASAVVPEVQRNRKPKRLIMHAVDNNGKETVNMKVPFSLVRLGLKLGNKVASSNSVHINDQTAQYLNDIDFDEITADIATGEIELPYVIMEAEDDASGTKVYIAIE